MKRLFCFLAVVGLIFSAGVALAQTGYSGGNYTAPPAVQPRAAVSTPIAVIDFNRVIEEHARYKDFQKAFAAADQGIGEAMKREQQTIYKLQEQLRDFNMGTQQYTNIDTEITNRTAKFRADLETQKKQWLIRQAEMFHVVSTEIQQEVERIAVSRGILMVLKNPQVKSDPSKPATVEVNLNKQVLWVNPSLDITDEVIRRFNPNYVPGKSESDMARNPGGNTTAPPRNY